MLVGIFNDHSQARVAQIILDRAEDPDTWVVHLDDGIDALAGTEKEGLDHPRRGDRVAIERKHLECMAGQRDAAILNGARIQQMESTRCPGLTRMGSPAPSALSLIE